MSNYILSNDSFEVQIKAQLKVCQDVLVAKGEGYSEEYDRLHNFRTAAALKGTTMREALAGMMAKHTISVYDLCRDEELADYEVWDEKLTDHINYLLLLRAVIAEETINAGYPSTNS